MFDVIPAIGIAPIFFILTLPLLAAAIFLLLRLPDIGENDTSSPNES